MGTKKRYPFLDYLQWFLGVFIAVLFLTGGYRTPRFELSQVDLFAWFFLFLGLYRKHSQGAFLGPPLATLVTRINNYVTKNPRRVLFSIFGVHVVVHTVILTLRQTSFHTNAFDQGYIDQSVWSLVSLPHEKFLYSTIAKGNTYLGEHFSPILALLAPLYALYPSISWLFFAQSVLIGSGALLVFALCRTLKLSPGTGVFLALCYLVYQPVRGANLFDFREDAFYIPLLFGVFITLLQKRWFLMWGLVVALYGVKENAPIATFLIGVLALMQKDRKARWQGAALCVLSVVVFFTLNLYVTPRFSGSHPTVFARGFSWMGSSNQEVLSAAHGVSGMKRFFNEKLDWQAFKYFLLLFIPLFPLLNRRSLGLWLLPLPLVAMNLLISPKTMGFHYELILTPFVFLALAVSLPRTPQKTWPVFFTLLFCVGGRGPLLSLREYIPQKEHRQLCRLLRQIPPNASTVSHTALQPHLTHRRHAQLFSPEAPLTEDLVLTSPLKNIHQYAAPSLESVRTRVNPQQYRLILRNDVLWIWCRKDYCAKHPEVASRFAIGPELN